MEKIGKNKPCPCGSGKKYKMCCMTENGKNESRGIAYSQNEIMPFSIPMSKPKELESIEDEYEYDENDIIDMWWKEFMPFYRKRNIDEMLPRIYKFLETNPKEFIKLDLQNECLFELKPDMENAGKLDEYIQLLETIRKKSPETFDDSCGPLANNIIEYKVSLGHNESIDEYLKYYLEVDKYDSLDYLNETIELLFITGREKEYSQFLNANNIGEFFMLMFSLKEMLLNKDNSVEAIDNMLDITNYFKDEQFIKDAIEYFNNYNTPLDIIKYKKKNATHDNDICIGLLLKLAGYMYNEKSCSYGYSIFISSKIVEYIIYVLVENKQKKNCFTYKKELINSFISNKCTQMFGMFLAEIPSIATIQGFIYFYDYLNFIDCECGFDRKQIKDDMTEYYNIIKKGCSESKSSVKRIFSTFPEYKGFVDDDRKEK